MSGIGGLMARAFGLGARANQDELMDTLVLPPNVADRTLRFLEFTNRRFGGTDVILRHFERWAVGWRAGDTISVLDVGTGAADIPKALVAWAETRGRRLHVTAIDMAPDIAEVARSRVGRVPSIHVEEATLDSVAASGRRFDYVIASLFLHHVPPDRLRDAVVAVDRLAVRGVILSDLVRSPIALLGVGLLARVAGNRIVRHDGPLSVRRAFTVAELRTLVAALGLRYLQVRPEGWFRLSVAGEKEAHA